MWHDIEGPEVLSPGGGEGEAPLRLFGLPEAVAPFARSRLGDGDPAARAACRDALVAIRAALLDLAAQPEALASPVIVPIEGMTAAARALLDDALGEGEATILIAGPVEYQIQETLFPGVWDVRTFDAEGAALDRHVEIGPVPMVVTAAARDLTADRFVMPDPRACPDVEALMNVMPLLAEIDARMAATTPGMTNHVISLTNLPMTDADLTLLGRTIGGGVIRAHSKGYGATRVTATRARGVWQVEYLNAMGTVILDTLEIGGPPAALLAGREDFEDSAERVGELLDLA
jgi:hydrogenase-1 operon protein HyaF